MPPSSSGPGRGPLKAKTGVRVSVGAQIIHRGVDFFSQNRSPHRGDDIRVSVPLYTPFGWALHGILREGHLPVALQFDNKTGAPTGGMLFESPCPLYTPFGWALHGMLREGHHYITLES